MPSIDTYIDELKFLVSLKRAVSILNNRIHDKLSLVAIEKLKNRHPELELRYGGAGVGGIDIQGFGAEGTRKLIAEVKTTETSVDVRLRGPQKAAIERDLQRLSDEPGDLLRYLVVISQDTKNAVERQIRARERFPNIQIIDAIGLVQLDVLAVEDDDE